MGSEPELTPMRIGVPALVARRATSATFSRPPMLPGVEADAVRPGVDRLQRERVVEVDVGDHRNGRLRHDRLERHGVLVARHGDPHQLAARLDHAADLRDGRLDVARVRLRHRLHDDGRPAADRDAADPYLALGGHAAMLSGGHRRPGSLTTVWRHVRAIGVLPGLGVVGIPALVLATTDFEIGWGLDGALQVLPAILGVALMGAGLALMYRTIALFAREGEGTLAPWDPTRKLVVRGPYRFVRNPMIVGVLSVVLGEAALFGSPALLVWGATFFALNAVWFPLVEEPGLVERFGDDYEAYRRNVPRWLPRRTPWNT